METAGFRNASETLGQGCGDPCAPVQEAGASMVAKRYEQELASCIKQNRICKQAQNLNRKPFSAFVSDHNLHEALLDSKKKFVFCQARWMVITARIGSTNIGQKSTE
jgi:hypothetical protein